MQFQFYRWDRPTPPQEAKILKMFRDEGLSPFEWSNAPGDVYAAHFHPYNKVLIPIIGSITWILPETNQEILALPGDRLDLPAGYLHAARVGDQGVSCLEAHISSQFGS